MKKKSNPRLKGSKEFGRQLKIARGADPDLYEDRFGMENVSLMLNLCSPKSGLFDTNRKRMDERFEMLFDWQSDPTVQARRARKRGLHTVSIRKMAELLGISKNTLVDYENGVRYPPIEFVFDFCAARDIHPDELVTAWITHHPNPNVQKQKNLGYINNFFVNQKGDIRGHEKRNVTRFITAAIQAGVWYANANVLSEEKAGKVAVVAAYLMQSALAKGREVHPDSIVFEVDESDPLLSEEYREYLFANFQYVYDPESAEDHEDLPWAPP